MRKITSLFLAFAIISIISCKDEECTETVWYEDSDSDGYGNVQETKIACEKPNGYVANKDDFDDLNQSAYPGAVEICDDGIDNNNNGFKDCEDFSCDGSAACISPEICNDGVDNDGDGFTDCDDFDCNSECNVEICNDGIDNDSDGFTDCDDLDCGC